MYRISELAKRHDLSRSTLLYYDRIGLLSPSGRSAAGYRLYNETDAARLEVICTYRRAGLSLEDIRAILESGDAPERDVLERRLQQLGREVLTLQNQQKVLAGILKAQATGAPFAATDKELWVSMFRAAGMDEAAMDRWHREFEQRAPEDHHAFLLAIGISEKEALQIRKLSRNLENNEMEMKYFYEFYEPLERLAPGSRETTLGALQRLPALPAGAKTLDVGCGCGAQTLVLAEQLPGTIIAVDNHQPFLDSLQLELERRGLSGRVKPQPASMFELPFDSATFDLVWSEGAIYIIGFAAGLKSWRRLLKPGGLLAVSEVVWLTPNPAGEIADYWIANYPAITDIETNRQQIESCGYRLLDDFTIPASDWQNYYRPQRARLREMRERYTNKPEAQAVCDEIEREIGMYEKYGDSYGYQFYLLQRQA